jgi:tetratricopeptide (TPR) repeat protein
MNPSKMQSALLPPFVRDALLGALCAGLLTVAFAPAAQAQDGGPSEQDKALHYSLYYEDFKNENYAAARDDLVWILENAPGFPKGTKNDDRNFERAVELYAGLAEQASSDANRAAYLDTAATYLVSAPETMEEKGITYDQYRWELEKGRFMQQYGSAMESRPEGLKDAVSHYVRAFEMSPDAIDPYYINQIVEAYQNDNEQNELLAFLDQVAAERGDDEEAMKIVNETRKSIFGRNPQARVNFLESQLEKSPEDAEIMAQLFQAYVDQGNIQEASKLADRLMATEPPAEIVREVAKMRLEDGRPEEAFATYEQAQEQGAKLNERDFYNMGLAQQRMGNFAQARSFYRKALDQKEDFGQAYIAIGDLYTRAVSECGGSKMSRDDKAVYWLAVDMYQKAKQVDSSVESMANSKISSYSKYYPNQEDIFYRDDWTKGESFRIDYGCYSWINRSTVVRPS